MILIGEIYGTKMLEGRYIKACVQQKDSVPEGSDLVTYRSREKFYLYLEKSLLRSTVR